MTRVKAMAVSITCHRHISSGGYEYGSHAANNHNSSHPLHLAASTLAASPLYSDMEHAPSSSPAVPSLDLPSEAVVDKSHSCHSFDLARGVYILSATSDATSTATSVAKDGMVETFTLPSDKLRTPKRKRTASPPSPSIRSPGEIRSTSRSTRRSPGHSRQSSLNSHRRTGTTTSLTSVPDTPVRRENLLALHRESCALFQDSNTKINNRRSYSPPATPPNPLRTYSELSSPPVTPILESPHSTFYPYQSSSPNNSNIPVKHVEITSTIHPEPTIIEWTSPSTRRREYEEIDRASSGVRGFWRRVAPRWCQFGNNSRVPFFEEGKKGKANYEGSVRRFRMDLPDDEPTETQNRRGLKLRPKLVVHAIGGRRSKTTSWL
ncbi:hypothetical protein BJY01DRAFT_211383 [Aspergillus pseudoustus]|uniref:Uncharacterized protein n=1 Tax=Aspergillus pseudoustus TaxID=1810923 RepID=A0ABR4KC50_9EURO